MIFAEWQIADEKGVAGGFLKKLGKEKKPQRIPSVAATKNPEGEGGTIPNNWNIRQHLEAAGATGNQ